MYVNNAYLNNITVDIEDISSPLIVTSCGTYKMKTQPSFDTVRPNGRIDYQLLYVASGTAHFYLSGEERLIHAGHMILYRPNEPQHYEYFAADQTEVYWVHFTGIRVDEILASYGMGDRQVYYCGTNLESSTIFRSMIDEMQICRENFEEMLAMYLRQIFIQIRRSLGSRDVRDSSRTIQLIDEACAYFSEHYSEALSVDKYAERIHVSISWFIRSFKEHTGITPMQYILSRRMHTAQALLHSTSYNITEIARIVGYENPLYFSRLFRKMNGISPSEYRKKLSYSNNESV